MPVASTTFTDSDIWDGNIILCVFCIRLSELVGRASLNMLPESLGRIGIPDDPLRIVTTFLSLLCKIIMLKIIT